MFKHSSAFLAGIVSQKINSIFCFFHIQNLIIREYPAELIVTLICCIFVTLQSAVVALIAEKDHPKAWRLESNMELIAIGYSVSIEKMTCSSIIGS